MYDEPWSNAKTSGRMSNSATANTAPELKPSSKCSRSRNRMAVVPPNPVETSVTMARSIGAHRMNEYCSEFNTDGQIQPAAGNQTRPSGVANMNEHGETYAPVPGESTTMMPRTKWILTFLLAVAVLLGPTPIGAFAQAGSNGRAIAVFSGGCFWGVDAVFKHVKGVSKVVSGYAGGAADTANYQTVSTGTTGHAESVQVTYDPSKVSYDDLLKVFFFVAHDPTELNRQGPDSGTQYRSSIFYENDAQKKMADDYIAQLDRKHSFSKPIVTKVVPLTAFYPAEDYHQNYLALHPDQPYIVFNDMPKLEQLQKDFPGLYQP